MKRVCLLTNTHSKECAYNCYKGNVCWKEGTKSNRSVLYCTSKTIFWFSLKALSTSQNWLARAVDP